MALDDVDRNVIRDEVRRSEDHLATKIELLSQKMNGHLTDRFAHGWDHQRVQQGEEMVKEWLVWRQSIDRWRWGLAGGLGFLAVEIPVIAALLALFVHR